MGKKLLATLALIACGAAAVALFRGSRLFDRARKASDADARIAILEREQTVLPVHAEIFNALGKAYFEKALSRLGQPDQSGPAFEKSHRNYLQALVINPFSAFTHFDFAQALLYMNHLPLAFRSLPYFEEFRRSAELASHEPKIFFEVSKVLLSRWTSLGPEEQGFALEVLKKAVTRADPAQLMSIFHLWELNAKDFKNVEKVLPRDRLVYRQFAQFLGERSLDLTERVEFLSQAESLDFENARNESSAGQNSFQQFKLKEAIAHFQASLESLAGIQFYQSLLAQSLIDPLEFQMIQKDIQLGLAKCRIEETRNLESAIPALRAYLALEDRPGTVSEIERFLKERGLIQGKSGPTYKDFSQLSFEALLSYKLNRYRDIVDIGTSLEQNFLVIPEAMKPEYAKILELVGDSYQKLDFIYESNNFFQKARSVGGENLSILLKVRRNFERLNDAEKIKAVNAEIAKLISPPKIMLASPTLVKGVGLVQRLTLDGSKVLLTLHFAAPSEEPRPLVSVFLNGQVVWEDYLKTVSLTIGLSPNLGLNTLKIVPVNQTVVLKGLSVVLANEGGKESAGGNSALGSRKTGKNLINFWK